MIRKFIIFPPMCPLDEGIDAQSGLARFGLFPRIYQGGTSCQSVIAAVGRSWPQASARCHLRLCPHHANVSLHSNNRRMEMEAEWVSIVESNKLNEEIT